MNSFTANDLNENEKKKPLYESFVMSRDPHSIAREETFREKKRDGKANYVNRDNPQQGNTIYIHGENLTEDILRLGFSTFGTVLNITTEHSKKYVQYELEYFSLTCVLFSCGFVTYDSIDTANLAINEMNGKTINGILLKVSLARRQPAYNAEKSKPSAELNNTNLSTPEAWSAIASSLANDNPENPKKRTIVSYEEDDIYEPI